MRPPLIGFGDALRRYRKAQGMTQDQMAEFLSQKFGETRPFNRAVLSQWESEREIPGNHKIAIIEQVVGVEPGTYIAKKFLTSLQLEGVKAPKLEKTLKSFTSTPSKTRAKTRKIPAHS